MARVAVPDPRRGRQAPSRRSRPAGPRRQHPRYDPGNQAADAADLLDVADAPTAPVIAMDVAVPVAFLLAMGSPERLHRLVLMEGLLPGLPGAESFLAAGPPWWFGFHAVLGLAEAVLAGHEGSYLDFFLSNDTGGRGVDRGPDRGLHALPGRCGRCRDRRRRLAPPAGTRRRRPARNGPARLRTHRPAGPPRGVHRPRRSLPRRPRGDPLAERFNPRGTGHAGHQRSTTLRPTSECRRTAVHNEVHSIDEA